MIKAAAAAADTDMKGEEAKGVQARMRTTFSTELTPVKKSAIQNAQYNR